MNLQDLKNEFPFKWRVSNTNKHSKKCQAVAYCDSRQVQDVLDEVCGSQNWQDKYYDVDGTTFCSIGIKVGDEWIWKSDCGSVSKIEAEKGESSDAFKRAAVKWGVGRFLYTTRGYSLPAMEITRGGKAVWVPSDGKGNEIAPWNVTKYINAQRGTTKSFPAADPTAKSDEAAGELSKVETWLEKYDTGRVLTALKWLGFPKTITEYRASGVADVPRVKYSSLCVLVKMSADEEVLDMCLEGFGYKSIENGGIAEMFKAEKSDKVFDEFLKIKKQEAASA
jgi:hypothetical protein